MLASPCMVAQTKRASRSRASGEAGAPRSAAARASPSRSSGKEWRASRNIAGCSSGSGSAVPNISPYCSGCAAA